MICEMTFLKGLGSAGVRRLRGLPLICAAALAAAAPAFAHPGPQVSSSIGKAVGTIKTIAGNKISLAPDSGEPIAVEVQENARLLRIAPGEKDLKQAAPMQLTDLQPGDRILVRGLLGVDGKTILASSVIAIKEADIAQKQTSEREQWRTHGIGGLVKSVDAAAGTIAVATSSGSAAPVTIHVTKSTIIRRYAKDSVKFDDAKLGALDQVKPGDQLRARGTRSADGAEFSADEIVSGSFRNIAGTVSSVNADGKSATVMDLATKKSVTVNFTTESQMRKLSPEVAERLAARMKAKSARGEHGGNAESVPARPPAGNTSPGVEGREGRRPGGSADLQQALSRMPAVTLADLQKGEAVMIVATEGSSDSAVTAITLLAGVEPILQATSKGGEAMTLSPWSLGGGGGEGGDAGGGSSATP